MTLTIEQGQYIASLQSELVQAKSNLLASNSRIATLEAQLAALTAERDAEKRRLDWLDANPRLVVASTGYMGAKDSWCWRDKTAALATHEAESLRAAIDAALATGEEGR